MMKINSPNYYIYLSGILLSIFAVLILPYTLYALVFIPVLFCFFYLGENFFIASAITLLIIFTRNEFFGARDILTLTIILISFFLYFKKYAFEFNSYPKIPKETSVLVIILTSVVFFSTIFNEINPGNLIPLIRTIVFFIFCYTIYAFIKGNKEIDIIIYSLFISQVFIGTSILFDFIKGGFSFFFEDGVLARYTGIIDNPNFIGLLTTISTNFILALYFSKKAKNKWYKVMLGFLLFNNFIIILFTDSRAAVISMIIGGVIILLTFSKKIFIKSLILTSIIIIILFQIPVVQDFIMILLRPQEFSAREHLWNSGIEMFYQNPIHGVGPEKFPEHFYSYLSSFALGLFTETGALTIGKIPSPHNFFILMAAENGFLGLLAGLTLFVIYLYMSGKLISWKKITDQEDFIIIIALFATGLGTLFRAFFEISGVFYYGYISRDLPFWSSIIILSYLYNKYKLKRFKV